MDVAIHLDSTRHTTGPVKHWPDSSSASGLGGFPRVAHGTDFLTSGVRAAAVPWEGLASTLKGTEADLDALSHVLDSRHITITGKTARTAKWTHGRKRTLCRDVRASLSGEGTGDRSPILCRNLEVPSARHLNALIQPLSGRPSMTGRSPERLGQAPSRKRPPRGPGPGQR
jgi:hypothetical protein